MEDLDFHAMALTGALKPELWPGGQELYQMEWLSSSGVSKLSLGSRAWGQENCLPGTRTQPATAQGRAHGCRPYGSQVGGRCSVWCAQSGWCCCAGVEYSVRSAPACRFAHSSDYKAPTHR